jgi:tetratricopeptide (TPR) repeat protein
MTQEEELNQAITLIKAGKKSEAVSILKSILKADRNNELAWLWLSACADKPEDKVFCFQEALRINPNNEHVKKALKQLEPNHIPEQYLSPVSKDTSVTVKNNLPIWIYGGIVGLAIIATLFVISWVIGAIANSSTPDYHATETYNAPYFPVIPTDRPILKNFYLIRPGTYIVGKDIQPGTYKGQAGSDIMNSCYWARLSNVSGDDDIIANDNATGQFYVQIKSSDFALQTRCELERIGN